MSIGACREQNGHAHWIHGQNDRRATARGSARDGQTRCCQPATHGAGVPRLWTHIHRRWPRPLRHALVPNNRLPAAKARRSDAGHRLGWRQQVMWLLALNVPERVRQPVPGTELPVELIPDDVLVACTPCGESYVLHSGQTQLRPGPATRANCASLTRQPAVCHVSSWQNHPEQHVSPDIPAIYVVALQSAWPFHSSHSQKSVLSCSPWRKTSASRAHWGAAVHHHRVASLRQKSAHSAHSAHPAHRCRCQIHQPVPIDRFRGPIECCSRQNRPTKPAHSPESRLAMDRGRL